MSKSLLVVGSCLAALVMVSGCHDTTAPRDTQAPASPRGLHSVTGDTQVYLIWLENTEADVIGYRVYVGDCADADCPYERIGATTETRFTVAGLTNGATQFFAVSAVDAAGNESRLSREDVFDTPRPEGFSRSLDNYSETPATSGYDFSAFAVRAFDDQSTDIYFGSTNGVHMMFTPFQDTDIQDAGYAASLDAIDYAPTAGWSPTGSVELILGHCYLVWTHDNHYAKFRVTNLDAHHVQFDWAYQVDPGNRELRAKRVRGDGPRIRREIRS
jgi:hypothetical protein